MIKLSTEYTFAIKKIYPISLWLMLLFIIWLSQPDFRWDIVVVYLIFGIFNISATWFHMTQAVDEVWDTGEGLLIKKGKLSYEIKDEDIKDTQYYATMRQPRAIIKLKNPNQLGKKFGFFVTPNVKREPQNTDVVNFVNRIKSKIKGK